MKPNLNTLVILSTWEDLLGETIQLGRDGLCYFIHVDGVWIPCQTSAAHRILQLTKELNEPKSA